MSEWFDLSQTFAVGMRHSPRLPAPRITPLREPIEGKPMASQFTFATHYGTHVDAAFHFFPRGRRIEEYPLGRFIGRGVVIDARVPPLSPIGPDLLAASRVPVEEGDIVLIYTGWGEKFCSDEYDDQPYLTAPAAQWLADRDIKLLGIDADTPDLPGKIRRADFDFPVHRILLSLDIPIVEHLCNLGPLAGLRIEAFMAPIKIKGSDGAPVRAFARRERAAGDYM